MLKFVFKTVAPGLMIMGGHSCSRCHEFKSLPCILDG